MADRQSWRHHGRESHGNLHGNPSHLSAAAVGHILWQSPVQLLQYHMYVQVLDSVGRIQPDTAKKTKSRRGMINLPAVRVETVKLQASTLRTPSWRTLGLVAAWGCGRDGESAAARRAGRESG